MQEESTLLRDLMLADLEQEKARFRAYRQFLHQHPEPTTKEMETARYISSILSLHHIEHSCGIAGEQGITAIVKGELEGPVIALRADMDALEIEEATGLPFSSMRPGVMHACGHDFHMTAVLATGILAQKHRSHLHGTLKLIFQPAEENGPRGGAKAMIDAGVLSNPSVDAIFACHVFPSIPRGTIWIPEGPVMAAVDNFIITIEGKGGHAAMPQRTIDPIPISAHLVLALNTVIARTIAPNDQAVISLGRIEGGNRRNVIPDRVALEGTMRTVSDVTRKTLREQVHELAIHMATSFGASAFIQWFESFGATINNTQMARLASDAIDHMGKKPLFVEQGEIQMTAEDFGVFLKHAHGAFILFGTDEGRQDSLHSASLTIADEVLDEMIMMYVAIISHAMLAITKTQRSETP